MEWLRWYHGTTNDPKFLIVARMSEQPKALVLAVWAALLESASEADDRGSLTSFDPEDVAAALDVETSHVVTICHAMSQKKLIVENRVANWQKRQPIREDEGAAERKRNQRTREKLEAQLADLQTKYELLQSMSHDVTQCHDVSHNVTLDRLDRGDKIDSSEDLRFSQGEREVKGLYSCGKVDNPVSDEPQTVDSAVLAGQKALVDKRQSLGLAVQGGAKSGVERREEEKPKLVALPHARSP